MEKRIFSGQIRHNTGRIIFDGETTGLMLKPIIHWHKYFNVEYKLSDLFLVMLFNRSENAGVRVLKQLCRV